MGEEGKDGRKEGRGGKEDEGEKLKGGWREGRN